MSQDIFDNAFRALRSETSEKKSNQEMIVDFRPDHFRRTLGFLGTSARDIEFTSVWNETFSSLSKVEQSAIAVSGAPARITWTGIPMRHEALVAKQRELNLTLDTFRLQDKELSIELMEVQEKIALSKTPSIPLTQSEQSILAKKSHVAAKIKSASEESAFVQRILSSKQDGGKYLCPVLVPARVQVKVLYFRAKPLEASAFAYLADTVWRTKVSWARITQLCPPQAIEQKEGEKFYKVLPMPAQLVTTLVAAQKASNTLAPKASGSTWSIDAQLAYAWYCTIRTYNHVWGSRGIVPIDRKIRDDGRYAKRAAKAGAKGEKAEPKTAARSGASIKFDIEAIIKQKLVEILGGGKRDKADTEVFRRSLSVFESASNRTTKGFVGISDQKKAEIYFVLDAAKDVMTAFNSDSFARAMRDWRDYLDDLEEDENDRDSDLQPLDADEDVVYSYCTKEFFAEESNYSSFLTRPMISEACTKMHASDSWDALMTEPVIMEEEKVETFMAADLDRYVEADAIGHRDCSYETGMCSVDCPKISEQKFEYPLADNNQSDMGNPEHLDTSSQAEENIDVNFDESDTNSNVLYVRGVSFYRINPSEAGYGIVGRGDPNLILPEGTALMTVVGQDGELYIHTGSIIEIPKEGLNPSFRLVDRPAGPLREMLHYAGVSASEIGERMSQSTFSKVMCLSLVTTSQEEHAAELKAQPAAPKVSLPKQKLKQAPKVEAKTPANPVQALERSVPLPAPKAEKPGKAKRAGKTAPGKESSPIVNFVITESHTVLGANPTSIDATIDGVKKTAWVSTHVPPHPAKGQGTQDVACECEQYPCEHTKKSIRNKIQSGADLAWNSAWLAAGGKVDTSAKKEAKAEKPSEPVEEPNPLRVKNLPRTAALSDADRKSLRKFFGLPDEIPDEEWKALTKDERAAFRRQGGVPHWATACVLRDHKNLAKILAKQLTKEKGVELLKKPPPKETNSCSLEWTKIKSRFDGVQLLIKPRSGKEKALKKAFDDLSKKFPSNPCLPKPKKAGGDKAGGEKNDDDDSSSKKKKGNTDSSDFGKLMKMMMLKMMSDM